MGSENSEESLRQSLEQYQLQLSQVNDALAACTDSESKLDLYALQEDLIQLVELTKESLKSLDGNNDNSSHIESQTRTGESFSDGNGYSELENIEEGLTDLLGSKCQAPWHKVGSSVSYHNALVTSIESSLEDIPAFEDIQVKVMYVNPLCDKMVPCSHYLEGHCKFSNECRYSHGEIVRFSKLKEFKEPDFHLVKENSVVLAKSKDNIWKRAIVTSVSLTDNVCVVKYECGSSRETTHLDLHDVLPLDSESSASPDNSDVTEQSSEEDNDVETKERRTFAASSCVTFGAWEKHTRSIGSKLMANMGYVSGKGLGKHGEGLVEPVSAIVLPPRKSLDYCMALREAAGNNPDLFKADKKIQSKPTRIVSKLGTDNKKPKKDVFSFINSTLTPEKAAESVDVSYKDTSDRILRIENFKVDEEIVKQQNVTANLQLTLTRLPEGSPLFGDVSKKLRAAQWDLDGLKAKKDKIDKEQTLRETKRKMLF